MLTPKQRAYLRSLAQTKEPSLAVGKGAVDANVTKSLDAALTAHELVKVRVLVSVAESIDDIARSLVEATKAELVAKIGHVLIVYRARKSKPGIVLP